MKPIKKKLFLNKTTVKHLTDGQLDRIGGGLPTSTIWQCAGTDRCTRDGIICQPFSEGWFC